MERPAAYELLQSRLDRAESQEEAERIQVVIGNLERGWSLSRGTVESLLGGGLPKNSMQSWRETLYATVADGTAVTAAAKTILVPDFTLPANYMYQGRVLKYTLFGKMSSAITTPGTFVHSLNWGGSGGIVLAASGAWAPDPTAASTNIAWRVEYDLVCRLVGSGTSGTILTFGQMDLKDYDDASATSLKGNLDMMTFPDAAAAVGVDTTSAKALSPTVTPSVATGSVTAMLAVLEALT